jgi:hypothetical protein
MGFPFTCCVHQVARRLKRLSRDALWMVAYRQL